MLVVEGTIVAGSRKKAMELETTGPPTRRKGWSAEAENKILKPMKTKHVFKIFSIALRNLRKECLLFLLYGNHLWTF